MRGFITTKKRYHRLRRCGLSILLAAALAAVLPADAEAARKAARTTSGRTASGSTTAKKTQSKTSKITSTVKLLSDAAADAAEQGLFDVLNKDRTRIIDCGTEAGSADVRYLSMAGGQERASAWNVTFSLPAGTSADGTATTAIGLTLKDAMNGRTLREGESLQAFYDTGCGVYYRVPTAVSGDIVSVTIPVLTASDHQYLILVITSGSWRAGEGYDYLAIGNSITLHPRQSYWPDAMGMGATELQKDYYHLVCAGLSASHREGSVHSGALNYAIWEISSGARESVLYLLDPYLSADLELVTIQLGENAIPDAAGFAEDFPELIRYIRKKAPNAQLVIVGNFWNCAVETAVKQQCAAEGGLAYVDLSDISVEPYVSGTSSPYVFGNELAYDANGAGHTCSKEAVSCHPNNAGMQVIAQRILQAVGS